MSLTVSTVEHLDSAELSGVITLIEHVTSADGLHPLSEHVYLHLRHGEPRREEQQPAEG